MLSRAKDQPIRSRPGGSRVSCLPCSAGGTGRVLVTFTPEAHSSSSAGPKKPLPLFAAYCLAHLSRAKEGRPSLMSSFRALRIRGTSRSE